jgi:hypothetical protein
VRADYLQGPSALCFTTDIEWSPEWAIRDLFELSDRYGVPLTPFLTHRSDYLWQRLESDDEDRKDAGVHPNFLPGSTHGRTSDEVIETMAALWPDATSFRSHCFYDDTRTLRKLEERGFRYDSNACAFLQPLLTPMRTATSVLRFPVFWEDDLHSAARLPWAFSAINEALDAPGLKIFNVHPIRVALNIPTESFYESKRVLYKSAGKDATLERYRGPGTRTFLEVLFNYATSQGRRPVRLSELYRQAVERGIAVPTAT